MLIYYTVHAPHDFTDSNFQILFCHLVLNRIKVLGFDLFSQFEFHFIQ